MRSIVLAALSLSLIAQMACTKEGPAASDGSPKADAGRDTSSAPDRGLVGDGLSVALAGTIEDGVYRELIFLPAPAPAKNPISGVATPTTLDRATLLRYRSKADAELAPAILVCMPGMPAGAMAFDQLARRMVKLSAGKVEVWAIDRRANQLEDLTGMQAAEAKGDPDLAWRYYDQGLRINGKRYGGPPFDVGYMSEWGLSLAVNDLRAAIDALVKRPEQRRRVVLLGHSFGAAVVQAYAAWSFDEKGAAHPAAADLAGLVLVDGGLQLYRPIAEDAYLKKGASLAPGLDALRAGRKPYLDYYGFGVEAFLTVEISALRAWLDPRQVVRNDKHVDRFATLLFLKKPPPLTAAAMVGFVMDESSSPVPGMRASCGASAGPVQSYRSPLTGEDRLRPTHDDRVYDWLDYDQVSPKEKSSIAVIARVAHEGPSNRVEWYMPSRLVLDVAAVSDLSQVSKTSWHQRYGLNASAVAQMDAPVLAILAGKGIVPKVSALDSYRLAIAPHVGAGRPLAGADRDPKKPRGQSGFAVLDLVDHAHDDLVHGSGAEADTEIYRPLLEWILAQTK